MPLYLPNHCTLYPSPWRIFRVSWHHYYHNTLSSTYGLTILDKKNISFTIVWFVLLAHDIFQPYERNHLFLKMALILLDDVNLNPRRVNRHQIKDHEFDLSNTSSFWSLISCLLTRLGFKFISLRKRMPFWSEDDSLHRTQFYSNSLNFIGLKELSFIHFKITSLLHKIDELCCIAKISNATVISRSEIIAFKILRAQ